jgi:hypothetical protein
MIKDGVRNSNTIRRAAEEFAGAQLGDERRTKRLIKIAAAVERDPAISFPKAMRSDAELEAFYRFINNDGFSAARILEPHREATWARAKAYGDVLVIHDTTHVELPGEPRSGMGLTSTGHYGFLAHVSLVVSRRGQTPLGVPRIETLTRSGKQWTKRKGKRRIVEKDNPSRESLRWMRAVQDVEEARADKFDALHVIDAEGDFFELFSAMHEAGARFIIRAGQLSRNVIDGELKRPLADVANDIEQRVTRTIEISGRKQTKGKGACSTKRHPPRRARTVRVAIGATRIEIPRTHYSSMIGDSVGINLVRVWETSPEKGEPEIEWVLFTTEPVRTKADLESVIDAYRCRWIVEDFFKALKTGCALEKRQTESYPAMCRVLSLLAPIACRLLLLRAVLREAPNAKASALFDAIELKLIAGAQVKPAPIPKTIEQALALLARLGGHIRNNGPPGWQTLARGFETLLSLKLGWNIAHKCDR